jgi:hypothetical protein
MAPRKKTLEMRVMERAVELMGSHKDLANHLKVSQRDLMLWLEGFERPTRAMFIAAIDVLLEKSDTVGLASLHSLQGDHDDPLAFIAESRRAPTGAKAG